MGRPIAIVGVAEPGLVDVAQPDRPALDLVAVEQMRAGPALHGRSELPADIVHIAHAGIEAEAARRVILMRGVADQEHAADTIAVGDDVARAPAQHGDDLARDVGTGDIVEHRVDVDGIGVVVELFARQAVAIELLAVDHHEVAPIALLVDEEGQRRLAFIVMLPQLGQAHESAEMIFGLAGAAGASHLDAELAADAAVAAAAIGDILRA